MLSTAMSGRRTLQLSLSSGIALIVLSMLVLGIAPQWQPALSFLLVLAWWEAPKVSPHWRSIYRGSAALLSLFLLVFTIWLPLTTPRSLMITWAAGAAVVALLGLRHGWMKL